MSIELKELFVSGTGTFGGGPGEDSTHTLVLGVTHAQETIAQVYAALWSHQDLAPDTITLGQRPGDADAIPVIVHKQSIALEEAQAVLPGKRVYRTARIHYGLPSPGHAAPPASTYSFDISTQTKNLSAAYAQSAHGPDAPDMGCAINVRKQHGRPTVDGVDIPVPTYTCQETRHMPDSAVTPAYRNRLADFVGRVNSAAYQGFAPGEVLLTGVSGSPRNGLPGSRWALTFRYAISRNRSGVVMGGIHVGDVMGWQYAWAYYDEYRDAAAFVVKPVGVYVATVYETADFNLM